MSYAIVPDFLFNYAKCVYGGGAGTSEYFCAKAAAEGKYLSYELAHNRTVQAAHEFSFCFGMAMMILVAVALAGGMAVVGISGYLNFRKKRRQVQDFPTARVRSS